MLNQVNPATAKKYSIRFARRNRKVVTFSSLSFSNERKNGIFATGKVFCKKLSTGAYQIRWVDAQAGQSALAYGSTLHTAYHNLTNNYLTKYYA